MPTDDVVSFEDILERIDLRFRPRNHTEGRCMMDAICTDGGSAFLKVSARVPTASMEPRGRSCISFPRSA